jgi:hypothetical protein
MVDYQNQELARVLIKNGSYKIGGVGCHTLK